ncbi:hypothetical protein Fmac_000557 [Flemingia macrophylla]|uniref:Glutaredoxin domain-containing protein n=1 Tax=Flemingia macrophylla TaxID=520843 RepID=A0ABD1NEL0_9FABA
MIWIYKSGRVELERRRKMEGINEGEVSMSMSMSMSMNMNLNMNMSMNMNMNNSLSMELDESTETRIKRLIAEHPVIIFSRSSCCMCHVMKNLLATIGVHPTVIQLDDNEIAAAALSLSAPAAFIGGTCIGGLESLVALHVTGHLIPKLVQVGALWVVEENLGEQ